MSGRLARTGRKRGARCRRRKKPGRQSRLSKSVDQGSTPVKEEPNLGGHIRATSDLSSVVGGREQGGEVKTPLTRPVSLPLQPSFRGSPLNAVGGHPARGEEARVEPHFITTEKQNSENLLKLLKDHGIEDYAQERAADLATALKRIALIPRLGGRGAPLWTSFWAIFQGRHRTLFVGTLGALGPGGEVHNQPRVGQDQSE